MVLRNVRVDIRHVFNGEYHFDEEMFVQGRKIITDGIRAVKASIKRENFEAARQKLGQIFHPLQVFVLVLIFNLITLKKIQRNLYGLLKFFCQPEGFLQSQ